MEADPTDAILAPQALPPRRAGYQRAYAICAGLTGWAALVLQLALLIATRLGRGESVAGGLVNYFGFFTILTNLLVASALSLPWAAGGSRAARWMARPRVLAGIATSIALVGIVYGVLLRGLWQPQGLHWLADVLLHDAMPVIFLVYWWLFVPPSRLRGRDVANWAIYPALYFVYCLLRGAWGGPYPYPFIDVGQLGYAHVGLNALAMLLVFTVLGWLMIGLDRLKRGRWPSSPGAGSALTP
jgi:hypothetical protein